MTALLRETAETRVRLGLDIAAGADAGAAGARGSGRAASGRQRSGAESRARRAGTIATGDAFLDHILHTLARYAGFALTVEAAGDLRHHLVEDVGITLGLALRDEIPDSCTRYGDAVVPMDDALVHVAIDAGGRAFYRGPLPSRLYDHFLRSLATNAAITMHVRVLRGTDRHHIVEAGIKALGLALREAAAAGPAVFSTKGAVALKRLEED